ncbi:MAG: thiopurine S-methyltransferase [Burkholderiaceae bacterium]|nr:MAG: thiopurine S-methyltransferase [Burkholderiaceae bacterium]TAM05427.1 MAG: thiopurine S-methyltransferase [Pusillimonas sp.]
MDANFWLERWQKGQTGFHQSTVMPLLQKYWPQLSLPKDSQVLVPLCGKSLDMLWLAQQGFRVLGVELSPLAINAFFTENNLQSTAHDSPEGRRHVAGRIEILCADILTLNTATLAQCTGVYDRAALVALPPDMRARYVQHVYMQLPRGYRGLLLTLDYSQELMDGPPFAVGDAEVQALFERHSTARLISRRDILSKEPRFAQRGLTRLETLIYDLSKV